MHIHCIGLNHTTAPVKIREQLSLNEDGVRAALARIACGHIPTSIIELIILSTCNRTELYTVSNMLVFDELEKFLSDVCNITTDKINSHLYRFKDVDVIHHIFNVAAGLDSLVVGEPQILGQAARALELARGQNTAGPVLNRLFQSAIRGGKRARTETAISRNPTSIASLAAGVSERSVDDLPSAHVTILGAGEMAELAVESLRKRGVNHLTVINRTLDHTHNLADRWNAQVDTFENLEKVLVQADILIASTGAPHMIVLPDMVNAAMAQRPDRPLILIDIAVPRDIDPEVGNISNVQLYDIDNLNVHLEQSLAERTAEIPQVKLILAEEESKFTEFLKSLDMLPIIADMRQQAESIRMAELEKTLRRMPDLNEADRARIEAMTMALVKKILQEPTQRLRAEASSPRASEYATVARTLFGLKPDESLRPISIAAD